MSEVAQPFLLSILAAYVLTSLLNVCLPQAVRFSEPLGCIDTSLPVSSKSCSWSGEGLVSRSCAQVT